MKNLDNRTVHCVANGKISAYAKGIDLFQIAGPHYGVPVGCRLEYSNRDFEFTQKRVKNTNIWNYTVSDGENQGEITDFCHADKSILYRTVDFSKEAVFYLHSEKIESFYKVPEETCGMKNFYYGEIAEGEKLYIYSINEDIWRGFVSERPYYFGIKCDGGLCSEKCDDKKIKISGKKGTISIFFGVSFDEIYYYAKETAYSSLENIYNAAKKKWEEMSLKREKNSGVKDELLKEIHDDIYVLIKSQQSESGGVLAGYPYRLAYIRDSYGVNRGLLSLGAFEESEKLLRYYLNIYKKYGCIHNAQGTDSYAFHIHENDKTEITAYMVLMFLDYAKKTGKLQTLKDAFELIEWCIMQQHSILYNGMLPFNGDETYIAGFILPREVINHGSMEATMLYHKCCTELLKLADALEISNELRDVFKNDIEIIEKSFKKNFFVDGVLMCNNPHYYDGVGEPKFRNGIRMCGHGLGVGVLNKNHRYVCFNCYDKPDAPNESYNKLYHLQSPLLMAIYVGSTLIDKEILDGECEKLAQKFLDNGCRCYDEKVVGYDYGIMIYALKDRHPELIEKLKKTIVDMRDDCGAWSEYYLEGLPSGTMYRPWESGINLEALTL
ncbi:MAG: hypothetical protein E7480_05855 [Ruminococcaceae bacterium]|nr:hypothetical protein [Oscillospiraceae bacterium]